MARKQKPSLPVRERLNKFFVGDVIKHKLDQRKLIVTGVVPEDKRECVMAVLLNDETLYQCRFKVKVDAEPFGIGYFFESELEIIPVGQQEREKMEG